MKIKAIILDFDGTILESNNTKMLAYNDLFKDYPDYLEEMTDFHINNYTISRIEKFRYISQTIVNKDQNKTFDTMMNCFSHYVIERMKTCAYVPGAKSFLKEFHHQIPLYISSLIPQDELNEILNALNINHYFVEVFGNPPYSKENAIRHILAKKTLSPEEAIYIGDSISDYLATLETGIEFIGRNRIGSLNDLEFKTHKNLYDIAEIIRARI